jgi:predicted anti-sigma-YlaC factor YlaD
MKPATGHENRYKVRRQKSNHKSLQYILSGRIFMVFTLNTVVNVSNRMKNKKRILLFLLVCVITSLNTGCVMKIVVKKATGIVKAENISVFATDDDPQLVADALPFMLKSLELVSVSKQANPQMLYFTGNAFCTYAYAFVYLPADTVSDLRIAEKNSQYLRAKKLFLRAREYLLRALEIHHPGFTALLKTDQTDSAMRLITPADTSLLYWTASAWMGAFTADKFDMSLAVDVPKPVAFMLKLLSMNETFGNGSVHDFFVSYYGGMPASMGGSEEKARYHFNRSLELSRGLSVAPYLALALSVSVANQNVNEFKQLLNTAFAIDVEKNIPCRLVNILNQNRARWMLNHIDKYFLIDEPSEGENPQ